MSNWEQGWISANSIHRWRTATVFPLTSVNPPGTYQKRLGPSSYQQVPQVPIAEGQIKVYMDPATKIPLIRVAVRINGELKWRTALLGKRTFPGGADWDPGRNLQKDPRRRRIR